MTRDRNTERGEATRSAILDAIERYADEHGYSPTRREVAEAVGISLATATRQIRALVSEGRLEEGAGPRTLRVSF